MDSKMQILSRREVAFYFAAWIAAVLYSLHRFRYVFQYFEDYEDLYNDFEPGWKILDRKIDVSDEEWKVWIPLIRKLSLWIFLHIFVSQYLKWNSCNKMTLCCWYISISTIFLYCHFGLLSTICTLLLPCLSCLLTTLKNKYICWLVHAGTLGLIYWIKVSEAIFDLLGLDDGDHFLLTGAICWIQLRSISYSIDSIKTYKYVGLEGFFENLLMNLAYNLYLPTLFFGPVILYQQFVDGLNLPFYWNGKRLKNTASSLIRYIFWLYFTECALHFFYVNAIGYRPNIVQTLDPWVLYGYGYCMGQYFLNKYVIVYGLSCTICRADDIDAPAQPKCIGRIHLYSDMWKYFDRGLYKFLLRYIYLPLNPKTFLQKFLASALCFTFIYLWHGLQLYIFIWALLNFVGITIEQLGRMTSDYLYPKISENYLTLQNRLRLECALASPLLAFSAISNFYFFSGYDIGNIFMRRFLTDSWKVKFILLSSLYCCCHASTAIKRWEQRRSTRIQKSIS